MAHITALEDYILANITVAEYYDTYIKPLDKKFENGSLTVTKTVICPFHGDSDPSLGTMNDRHRKGIKLYHCLGCGATGTVIRMHQRIQRQYFSRVITDVESQHELVKLFNLDTTKIVMIDESSDQANFMKARLAIRRADKRYTIRSYQEDLVKLRGMRHKLSLDDQVRRINSATLKVLVTTKGLLD